MLLLFLIAGLLSPAVAWVVAQGITQAQGMTTVMLLVAAVATAGVWGGGAALRKEKSAA